MQRRSSAATRLHCAFLRTGDAGSSVAPPWLSNATACVVRRLLSVSAAPNVVSVCTAFAATVLSYCMGP
jgi:hypothetical protein